MKQSHTAQTADTAVAFIQFDDPAVGDFCFIETFSADLIQQLHLKLPHIFHLVQIPAVTLLRDDSETHDKGGAVKNASQHSKLDQQIAF